MSEPSRKSRTERRASFRRGRAKLRGLIKDRDTANVVPRERKASRELSEFSKKQRAPRSPFGRRGGTPAVASPAVPSLSPVAKKITTSRPLNGLGPVKGLGKDANGRPTGGITPVTKPTALASRNNRVNTPMNLSPGKPLLRPKPTALASRNNRVNTPMNLSPGKPLARPASVSTPSINSTAMGSNASVNRRPGQ